MCVWIVAKAFSCKLSKIWLNNVHGSLIRVTQSTHRVAYWISPPPFSKFLCIKVLIVHSKSFEFNERSIRIESRAIFTVHKHLVLMPINK